MKPLIRLFQAAITLAALYLVPVNLILNLPTTLEHLNALAPERFAVSWTRAWSLYPLRVQLQGVAADGQTPTEQWQLDAAGAAASLSLLPLLDGEVRIHDLDLRDIDLRLRPRPIPEQTDSTFTQHFPVIRNRDPKALAEFPSDEEPGSLRLSIDDVHVTGTHTFWVSHVRGTLPGELRGSFSLDSETGRIALGGGELDLALTTLHIGAERDVASDAWFRGRMEVPPVVLSELDAAGLIEHPEIDAEMDVPVQDLRFLKPFLGGAGGMDLRGKGRLRGRLIQTGGDQLIGTDLKVEATELRLGLARFDFTGDGSVQFKVYKTDVDRADLGVHFGTVEAFLKSATEDARSSMFVGRDLDVTLHMSRPDGAQGATESQLTLNAPSMQVPDLGLYDHLVPGKWGVRILGGEGELGGQIIIGSQSMAIELDLSSDEVDIRFGDAHIVSDLALVLRAVGRPDGGATLDLTGTRLHLDNARVAGAGDRHVKPWQGDLTIDKGRILVPIPADRAEEDPVTYLTETLGAKGFGKLLEDADGRLSATLTVSRLDWVPHLLDHPLGLTLNGSGKIDADLRVADGWLGKGTTLKLTPRGLQLGLLDHLVDGQGTATLEVVNGGRRPDLRLAAELKDAKVHRSGDQRPEMEQVRMHAEILVRGLETDAGVAAVMDLRIPSARIADVGVFNAYLPADTPIRFLSGEASLIGDMRLEPNTAGGKLLLEAKDVRLGVYGEELSGNLRVDVLLRDGKPADLRFDVSGSRVVLDGFQVAGQTTSYEQPDWNAHFEIEKAVVVWQKPLHLDMRALTTIQDTRPFIAVLDNVRGKHGWIDGLLEAERLVGHVELVLDGERAVLSDSMLGGGHIHVGAKGLADSDGLRGLVYARWNKLSGALEIQGEEKHFHLIGARAKFDSYMPGKTVLVNRDPEREADDIESLIEPGGASPLAVGASPSPKVDESSREPENPFWYEDL